MLFSFSYTDHDQNSIYGDMPYREETHFGQLTWDKEINNHDLLFGTALRYQYYDDNTTATVKKILIDSESLCARRNHLNRKHKVLLGARLDYNTIMGLSLLKTSL
jgi:outer membrane receptor for ferrienterochelin and colicins